MFDMCTGSGRNEDWFIHHRLAGMGFFESGPIESPFYRPAGAMLCRDFIEALFNMTMLNFQDNISGIFTLFIWSEDTITNLVLRKNIGIH